MKPHIPCLILLLALAFLTACAPKAVETPTPEEPEEPEVTTLTYAILSPENVNLEAINRFNRAHKGSDRDTQLRQPL